MKSIEWVKVSERLPDLDVPVWLMLADGSIFIGCRFDEGNGWLWECYLMPWINAQGFWECKAEMANDYKVSRWHELLLPIKVTG